jgi:hypothetical protein
MLPFWKLLVCISVILVLCLQLITGFVLVAFTMVMDEILYTWIVGLLYRYDVAGVQEIGV